MKNKWQITIDDLLTVFKTSSILTDAVNKEIGKNANVKESSISRIKNGKQTRIEHYVGQALLVLHVRYINKG